MGQGLPIAHATTRIANTDTHQEKGPVRARRQFTDPRFPTLFQSTQTHPARRPTRAAAINETTPDTARTIIWCEE